MTSPATNLVKAAALIALGLAIAVMGVYVANADDAPGAAGMGFLVMFAAVVLGVRTARGRLPTWAGRTALAVGALIAALAGFLTHAVTVGAPLFAQPQDVPSVGAAPSPPWAPAVDRARSLVRAAIKDQNLPGVSIAVGVNGAGIIWAEGFGWRDVATQTPVTPDTRFNIGTAASVVTPATVSALALTHTGAEPAAEWSPEHVGEPEEDFPPFTLMRHFIFQPLGLAPAEYPLPGDRATFYAPRTDNDPMRGRRLMSMRDLACCAGTMASYSTPSDLVRFALATKADSLNGELAGGSVTSLTTRSGTVVAVSSNVAHANTAPLARNVADVFAEKK